MVFSSQAIAGKKNVFLTLHCMSAVTLTLDSSFILHISGTESFRAYEVSQNEGEGFKS